MTEQTNPMAMEQIDPMRVLDNPPARRLWLLLEAVRSLPFDRAVEIARIAEAFITGSAVGATTPEPVPRATIPSENPAEPKESIDQTLTNPTMLADRPSEHHRLLLSSADRDRLLDRLANGARNAELARELGISAKQVQGLRMGCARELARRRAGLAGNSSDQSQGEAQDPAASTSIDEIVRYLRQQDDVVVPQEDGGYLVNGRFQMSAAELIARANRMRSRQRQASLQILGTTIQVVRGSEPKSHPLFWENPARTERGPNGAVKPADTKTDDA